MTWYPALKLDDLPDGKVHLAELGGKKLAVCNTGKGIYTVDNKCTHDGGPLGEGTLDGDQIECPRHGARFDVKTGKVLRLPAVRAIHSYKTRVTDGQIEVEIED